MNDFLKKILKSGSGVFTSRILGLFRDIVTAAVFGASKYTDAFFVAFAIPNLFRALFAEGALSSAFLPILADKRSENGVSANRYMSVLIIYLSVIIGIICAVFIVLSDYVVLAFLPGYMTDSEIVFVASKLLKIVMPYLLLVSICGIFSGFLNLNGSFYVPHSSTALLNLFMILGAYVAFLFGKNIYFLAWGVFAGGFFQLLLLSYYSYLKGFRWDYSHDMKNDVKKTFLLIVPSILGVGITQLNFTVGRIFASFLDVGSISYLYYSNRLFQFPLGVFSIALSSVALAEFSKISSIGDKGRRNILIDKALLGVFTIIIPASLGLILLSEEISTFVFKRNLFNDNDVVETAKALVMYSAGLLFFSMVNLFTKVFHSEKDTKTPVKGAVYSFFINIFLMLVFMPYFKHAGIALASSGAAVFNAFFLYFYIKDYRFIFAKYFFLLVKIIISAISMVFIIIYLKNFHLNLLIVVFISAMGYFLGLWILKVNIIKILR